MKRYKEYKIYQNFYQNMFCCNFFAFSFKVEQVAATLQGDIPIEPKGREKST